MNTLINKLDYIDSRLKYILASICVLIILIIVILIFSSINEGPKWKLESDLDKNGVIDFGDTVCFENDCFYAIFNMNGYYTLISTTNIATTKFSNLKPLNNEFYNRLDYEDSIAAEKVNELVKRLNKNGANVLLERSEYLDYTDLANLGCILDNSTNKFTCPDTLNFLLDDSYLIYKTEIKSDKKQFIDKSLFTVIDNIIDNKKEINFDVKSKVGVRPVIMVSTSMFEEIR